MTHRIETVDTNIFLRLILNDNKDLRERSINLLSDSKKCFYLPDLTITEIVFIMEKKYHYTRAAIAEALFETLSAFTNIMYDPKIISIVLPFYAEHPSLSFDDCYLAYHAKSLNRIPIWTYDKKMISQTKDAKEPK